MSACLFVSLLPAVLGHGQLNYPPSTRQGIAGLTWPGALSGQGSGGYCEQPNSQGYGNPLNGACMLFSQPSATQPDVAIIPGEPTNNDAATRTHNVNVSSGPDDWTRKMPWRAPGSAPVLGSGCGVAGGGDTWNPNGGWPPTGMSQGADAIELPGPSDGPVTIWRAGSTVEVAFGIWANHGGGYAYRLCKNIPGNVTEQCFQRTPMRFAGDVSWLQHINGTFKHEFDRVTLSNGTTPSGSQWARIPIPGCRHGGHPDGHGFIDKCPSGETEYPSPLPGVEGFGYCNSTETGCDMFHDYSIVDLVVVPDVEPGNYLLSWRWDCEQTTQIWQNCADVRIE